MAITIFIQGVLTFCIASGMVHVDLRNNKISAFPYPWPDTAWGTAAKKDPNATRSPLVRWWRKFNNDQGFSRGLHFFSGSDVNDIFDRRLTWRQFFRRLSWSLWKGSVLSVIYFFILWPISVAIVARECLLNLASVSFLSSLSLSLHPSSQSKSSRVFFLFPVSDLGTQEPSRYLHGSLDQRSLRSSLWFDPKPNLCHDRHGF